MDDIRHGTGHDRLAEIRKRMRPVSELTYGQTPWDTLGHEDLVFLVQSYHAVVTDAHAVLRHAGRGVGEGERLDALAQLQAAESHVYSNHLGPTHEHVRFGQSDAGGDRTEEEALSKFTQGPVSDMLAFDAPRTVWWSCPEAPVKVGGTWDTAGLCGCTMRRPGEVEGCATRRATWDDWRAQGGTTP